MRYYLTQRPLAPGAIPAGARAVADYDEHGANTDVRMRCPVCGAKMESSVCPICGMEPADQHTIRPAHGALNRPLLKREMKMVSSEPIEGQMRLCWAKMDEVDGYE